MCIRDRVYTTSVSKATLDECPMAYKGMQDILDNIGPTADVVKAVSYTHLDVYKRQGHGRPTRIGDEKPIYLEAKPNID